jgi:hypothetical protein
MVVEILSDRKNTIRVALPESLPNQDDFDYSRDGIGSLTVGGREIQGQIKAFRDANGQKLPQYAFEQRYDANGVDAPFVQACREVELGLSLKAFTALKALIGGL